MPRAYYNEHDPYAAQWLRNLISANLIAEGDVDERSILDVRPDDLRGYTQCHFFAGIGGWSHALRLAEIPDDYPLWTGSPPCQPFSSAGKQRGKSDERHLWPVFFDLIRQCRPAIVFGEQVESAIAHGWLDDLQNDMEGEGYACGAVIASACSVGAPHIRQRLFWVGYATGVRCDQRREAARSSLQRECSERRGEYTRPGFARELQRGIEGLGRIDRLADPSDSRRGQERERISATGSDGAERDCSASTPDSFWRVADWLFCRDGKWRPVEPELEPLVDGLPTAVDGRGPISRVGTLKGFGNAIVPQVAAEFIKAVMEAAP